MLSRRELSVRGRVPPRAARPARTVGVCLTTDFSLEGSAFAAHPRDDAGTHWRARAASSTCGTRFVTRLLIDLDRGPNTVDPVTITDGTLQLHISSCVKP